MKKIIWGIAAVMGIVILSLTLGNTEKQELTSQVKNTVNASQVEAIKSLKSEGSSATLGELIEAGVSSASYELYDPAEDGNTYVTIKGNITYNEQPVVVALQYKKVGEDSYEFYTMTYNDVPQNELEAAAFFQYLQESYDKKQQDSVSAEAYKVAPVVSQTESPKKAEKAEPKSAHYSNVRYGFSIDFSLDWGEPFESDNGDGAIFFQDDYYDVRAYGSYLMEDSLMEELQASYAGWEYEEISIKGAEVAYALNYSGEESFHQIWLAYKEGIVYKLDYTRIFNEDFEEAEAMDEMVNEMKASFKIH